MALLVYCSHWLHQASIGWPSNSVFQASNYYNLPTHRASRFIGSHSSFLIWTLDESSKEASEQQFNWNTKYSSWVTRFYCAVPRPASVQCVTRTTIVSCRSSAGGPDDVNDIVWALDNLVCLALPDTFSRQRGVLSPHFLTKMWRDSKVLKTRHWHETSLWCSAIYSQ